MLKANRCETKWTIFSISYASLTPSLFPLCIYISDHISWLINENPIKSSLFLFLYNILHIFLSSKFYIYRTLVFLFHKGTPQIRDQMKNLNCKNLAKKKKTVKIYRCKAAGGHKLYVAVPFQVMKRIVLIERWTKRRSQENL